MLSTIRSRVGRTVALNLQPGILLAQQRQLGLELSLRALASSEDERDELETPSLRSRLIIPCRVFASMLNLHIRFDVLPSS